MTSYTAQDFERFKTLRRMVYKRIESALKDGTLTKPEYCDGCGLEKPVFAHHRDYLRPMAVIWLCGSCHRIAHADLRRDVIIGAIGQN